MSAEGTVAPPAGTAVARGPGAVAPTSGGSSAEALPATTAAPSWRERAVERSLREARVKAQERNNRFLVAAQELLTETGSPDFTVQQLVERTRMSLRSFYQHFGSKDELLLVLFQESIRVAVLTWREGVDCSRDPFSRIQVVVEALYGSVASSPGEPEARSMRALAVYHLQLANERPQEFAAVLTPLRELLFEIVSEGAEAGAFRTDLAPSVLAVLVLQALVSSSILFLLNEHLVDSSLGVEQLGAFLRSALRGDDVVPEHRTPSSL